MQQREIRFRAWDKEESRWIRNIYLNLSGEMLQKDHGLSGFDIVPNDGSVVLMQFTGLKDKSGKDVYEGDILRRYMSGGWEQYPKGVHWDAGRACWQDGANPFVTAAVYEVIGNIYENPELLK